MAKPIKLRDFLKRVKDLDPTIEVFVNRGKGSHLVVDRRRGHAPCLHAAPAGVVLAEKKAQEMLKF